MLSGEWETADFLGCYRRMVGESGGYLGRTSRMKGGAESQVAKETHIRVIHFPSSGEAGASHHSLDFPPSGAKLGHASPQGGKAPSGGHWQEGPLPCGDTGPPASAAADRTGWCCLHFPF